MARLLFPQQCWLSTNSFEFDDLIVPVGVRVDSSLDMEVYAVNPAYNFIHSRNIRQG